MQGLALKSHLSVSPPTIFSKPLSHHGFFLITRLNQEWTTFLAISQWFVTICPRKRPEIRPFQFKSMRLALQLSDHSNVDMRLEFLFSVLQPWPNATPSFTEKGKDNSPASGTGKTDLLCSLFFPFQFSIEVNNWKAQLAFTASVERYVCSRPESTPTDQHTTVLWVGGYPLSTAKECIEGCKPALIDIVSMHLLPSSKHTKQNNNTSNVALPKHYG